MGNYQEIHCKKVTHFLEKKCMKFGVSDTLNVQGGILRTGQNFMHSFQEILPCHNIIPPCTFNQEYNIIIRSEGECPTTL